MSGLNWTTPRTYAVGDIVTATMENAQRDQLTFLANPPILRAVSSAAQTILHATLTALSFDTNFYDTYNGHSTTTANNNYVVQTPGYYRVDGLVAFSANAAGARLCQVYYNGSQTFDSYVTMPLTGGTGLGSNVAAKSTVIQAAVGDTFQIVCYQTSGGPLTTQTGDFCAMQVELVHV